MLLLCLSSDNVQHELQRWPLINIINIPEKKKTTETKETYAHSRTPSDPLILLQA